MCSYYYGGLSSQCLVLSLVLQEIWFYNNLPHRHNPKFSFGQFLIAQYFTLVAYESFAVE